jgi:predicted RecA/RadA family phage recombinase
MSKKIVQPPAEAHQISVTNSSGSAFAADSVQRVGGRWVYIPHPIANGATGVGYTEGTFLVPKSTGGGTALAQGVDVGWDSANKVVTTDTSGGVFGTVWRAAVNGDAEVQVRVGGHARYRTFRKTVSAGEDSANKVTFTLTGLNVAIDFPVSVLVYGTNAAGKRTVRVPSGAASGVTVGTLSSGSQTIDVEDANLAANEIVVMVIQVP